MSGVDATLLTAPLQAGKSRALWRRALAEAPGDAVMVTPQGRLDHDLASELHEQHGDVLLPAMLSLQGLVEAVAAAVDRRDRPDDILALAHRLRPRLPQLFADGPLAGIAGYPRLAHELAELIQRFDEAGLAPSDARLAADRAGQLGDPALRELLRGAAHVIEREPATRSPGAWLRALAAEDLPLPWRSVYLDDLMALSPAMLGLLAALTRGGRRLIATAVDDERLGDASPARRLPGGPVAWSTEAVSDAAPDDHPARRLGGDAPLSAAAAARVHALPYRDAHHAGRAIAALLRRQAWAPGEVTCFVRNADAEALHLADALAAAGVAVHLRCRLPLASTLAGGAAAALAQWCESGSWRDWLAWARHAIALGRWSDAPVDPDRLQGPWGDAPAADAVAFIRDCRKQTIDDIRWQGDREVHEQVVAWLTERLGACAAEGSWYDRFLALAQRFDLIAACQSAFAQLQRLAEIGPCSSATWERVLAAATVLVERGCADGASLAIRDAVRDRSRPRRVAICYGLAHGAWPRLPTRGALLGEAQRRLIAEQCGVDPWDEAGRLAGEQLAIHAALARGREAVVLGIPCGEQEPSPWLAQAAEQLAWDLEAERARADALVAPGAPMHAAEAQGAHEAALLRPPDRQPDFRFRVAARRPSELRLRPSALNDLIDDPMWLCCQRWGLDELLRDHGRIEEGLQLHDLLARPVQEGLPIADWPRAVRSALLTWARAAADPLRRAERLRRIEIVRRVWEEECRLLHGLDAAAIEAEVELRLHCPIPWQGGHDEVVLRGSADRLDRLADGSLRIVDYKLGAIGSYKERLKAEDPHAVGEGQLLAYARACQAEVRAAYYCALGQRSGAARAGYGDPHLFSETGRSKPVDAAEMPTRWQALEQLIAAVAAGSVYSASDGVCAARGLGAVVRADEARLDQGGDGDASDEAEGEA